MHVAAERAVGSAVGFADEGLEEALVEDGGEEGERAVGVAGLQIDDSLALVEAGEVELVAVEDVADLPYLQGCEAYAEADDDAFLGLAGPLGEGAVLGAGEGEPVEHSEGLPVVLFGVCSRVLGLKVGFGELGVDDGFPGLVLFAGLHHGDHVDGLGQAHVVADGAVGAGGGAVLGVVDPGDESGQQGAFGAFPEPVGVFPVAGGVGDDVVDQPQDRRLWFRGVEVAHGVEPVGPVEVDQVECAGLVAA